MRSDEERLDFVVQFAQMQLKPLGTTEGKQIRKELSHFLAGHIGDSLPTFGGIAAATFDDALTLSDDALIDLQKEIRLTLLGILSAQETATTLGTPATATTGIPIHVTYCFVAQPSRESKPPLIFLQGQVRDAALFILATLMAQCGGKVRRCPECKQIFIRSRKQQFCGPRCAKRSAMREWRKTPQGKSASVRSSKAQYERKIRQQKGLQNSTIAKQSRKSRSK